MTDELQPKIDKFWAGLTPEERAKWWEPGDFALIEGTWVVQITRYGKYTPMVVRFLEDKVTPAPCPQLWWKLEAWLEKKTVFSLYSGVIWKYSVYATDEMYVNKDRRHALLDACLAVQRGRDEP